MVLQNAAPNLFSSVLNKREMQIQDWRNLNVAFFKKNPNFGVFYHFKYKHIGFSGQQRGGLVPYVIDPYVDSSKPTAQECSPENERNLQQRHWEQSFEWVQRVSGSKPGMKQHIWNQVWVGKTLPKVKGLPLISCWSVAKGKALLVLPLPAALGRACSHGGTSCSTPHQGAGLELSFSSSRNPPGGTTAWGSCVPGPAGSSASTGTTLQPHTHIPAEQGGIWASFTMQKLFWRPHK